MGEVVRVALGVLACATFATGAASVGEPRVTIYPPNAKAGARVSIYVHECTTTTTDVYASSMAFEGRHVRLARNGTQGGWAGSVEIDDDANSTAHEVAVRCSDRYIKAYLTVSGRGYPTVGPNTGGGGLAMSSGAEGPSRALWLVGAVGTLVVVTSAGVVARRRRGQ